MRYYALYNGSTLVAIGTGGGGTEITEAEYNRLLAEIRGKARLVDELYTGDITEADVPDAWREEITRRVQERRQADAEAEAEEPEETVEELKARLETQEKEHMEELAALIEEIYVEDEAMIEGE